MESCGNTVLNLDYYGSDYGYTHEEESYEHLYKKEEKPKKDPPEETKGQTGTLF